MRISDWSSDVCSSDLGRDAFLPAAVHDCGVGAMLWSYVIGYDGDRIKGAGPRNWADFWDVKRFPGKRGMRKNLKYSLEFALLADGVTPDTVYPTLRTPAGIDRAFRKPDARSTVRCVGKE